MPNFTKKAIKESVFKLLGKKPLSKITVKDIVDDCGVNRNTFYYHFDDIPALIQEMTIESTNEIISQYQEVESLEQCLDAILKTALKNKKVILNIYNSVDRQLYEQYFERICQHVVPLYVENVYKDKCPNEDDRKLIADFIMSECIGICIQWLNNGMDEKIIDDFHRFLKIRKNLIR